MNKGYTLVELMAVLVLLLGVVLISVPVISTTFNKSKTSSLEDYNELICEAAKNYFDIENLSLDENNTYTLTLGDLMEFNYISDTLKNPLTKEVETNLNIEIYLDDDGFKACQIIETE